MVQAENATLGHAVFHVLPRCIHRTGEDTHCGDFTSTFVTNDILLFFNSLLDTSHLKGLLDSFFKNVWLSIRPKSVVTGMSMYVG